MAEEMTEKPTEGTTPGGKYLTRSYLVRNLQNFWNKIKEYITNQIKDLVNKEYVSGAIDNAISSKADVSDLESLRTTVDGKASALDLESLKTTVDDKVSQGELTEKLAGKVNKNGNKVLSTYDFTETYKNKLDSLKSVTESEDGLMSAQDKKDLDNLVNNAVTHIDDDLNQNSEYPVQNSVITQALANKVDKENPLDSSNIPDEILSCAGNSNGDIIFTLHENTKHFKIHLENEIVESFYIKFKDGDTDKVFNSFDKNSRNITIPNPDGPGVFKTSRVYTIYVECLELINIGKYEPFILRLKRKSEDHENFDPSIFQVS